MTRPSYCRSLCKSLGKKSKMKFSRCSRKKLLTSFKKKNNRNLIFLFAQPTWVLSIRNPPYSTKRGSIKTLILLSSDSCPKIVIAVSFVKSNWRKKRIHFIRNLTTAKDANLKINSRYYNTKSWLILSRMPIFWLSGTILSVSLE